MSHTEMERKIRIACGRLAGAARTETILALRVDPTKLNRLLLNRFRYHRPATRKARAPRVAREVNVAIRLTYAEYTEVKARAKRDGITVSELFRRRMLA